MSVKLPVYAVMCTLAPHTTRPSLVNFVADYVFKSVRHGAVVRQIFNHGIAPTAFPFKDKVSTERYHDAQLVTLHLYSPENSIQNVVKELNEDDRVVRFSVIKQQLGINQAIGN